MPNQPRPGPKRRGGQPRKCLMCRETFSSEGAHNRICPKCKLTRTWRESTPDGTTRDWKRQV